MPLGAIVAPDTEPDADGPRVVVEELALGVLSAGCTVGEATDESGGPSASEVAWPSPGELSDPLERAVGTRIGGGPLRRTVTASATNKTTTHPAAMPMRTMGRGERIMKSEPFCVSGSSHSWTDETGPWFLVIQSGLPKGDPVGDLDRFTRHH
jgi:hypothetical protein